MPKNTNLDPNVNQVEEFTGKYESKNPIAKLLVNQFYRSLNDLLPTNAPHVLEVGCGAGFSTQKICQALPSQTKLTASDISPELVELARQRVPHVTFSVESIYQLNQPDNHYDLVICLETLEHLENPEQALLELARVTKHQMIVSVPREPIWRALNCARGKYLTDWGNTPGHINHWSTNQFMKFLEPVADIEKITTPLPWTIVRARKK